MRGRRRRSAWAPAAHRGSSRSEHPFRNDQDVAGLERDVFIDLGVVHDVLEVYLEQRLLVAVLADQRGAARRCVLGEAASQGDQLQQGQGLGLRIEPRLDDLAHHVHGVLHVATRGHDDRVLVRDHHVLGGIALLDEAPEVDGNLLVFAHDEGRGEIGAVDDSASEEEGMDQRHIALERIDTGLCDLAQQVDATLENLLRVGADRDFRHDDRVLGLELDVLAEIAVLDEAAEIHRDLLVGTDDVRGRQVRPLDRAAGQGDRLEQRCAGLERIDSRLRHLAHDVDAEASNLLDDDRDGWIPDRRGQPFLQERFNSGHGQAADIDLADQWEGNLAVGPDYDVLLELLVLPDDDVQKIVDANRVIAARPSVDQRRVRRWRWSRW